MVQQLTCSVVSQTNQEGALGKHDSLLCIHTHVVTWFMYGTGKVFASIQGSVLPRSYVPGKHKVCLVQLFSCWPSCDEVCSVILGLYGCFGWVGIRGSQNPLWDLALTSSLLSPLTLKFTGFCRMSSSEFAGLPS